MAFLLDTSALVKLYHEEPFSKALHDFLFKNNTHKLLITHLTELEFTAAVWAKVRNTEDKYFDKIRALAVLQLFETNKVEYEMIYLDLSDFNAANRLLNRLNAAGHYLRAPDALQLAVANSLRDAIDGFICFDKGLKNCALALEIPVISEEDF